MKTVQRFLAVLIVMTLGLAAWPLAPLSAAAPAPEFQGPFVSELVTPHLSPRVRDLPAWQPPQSGEPFHEINPRRPGRGGGAEGVGGVDPLVQPAGVSVPRTPDPILSFDGMSAVQVGAWWTPPDPIGDVGPNHYVQMVNVHFAIYDKSGTLLDGPYPINSLWAGQGGLCESNNDGDPIVLYDSMADRWVLAQFAGAATDAMCIAVSQTPDPTGAFYLYEFAVPQFPDYFKLGVWPDAYYMGSNEAAYSSYAFDRLQMLAGLPATYVRFTGETNFLLPADLDGATPPPVDSPGYFYTFKDNSFHGGNDRLEVFEFVVDFVTPGNSSFTLTDSLPLTAFNFTVCGYFVFNCIPQLGTTQEVDAVSEWPMWRLQYRNFDNYETLVGNFAVDVDGTDHAGIRWFELHQDGGGGWSLYQEGTYAPDAHHRFMGSIAMDGAGDIALGYSVSSTSMYPSLRYATRLPGDPLGTLQPEASLYEGAASQSGSNRWGDYSSMNVDPVDDCTFWYTGEYATGGTNWATRIGTFKVPGCGDGGDFTLAAEPDTFDVCAPDVVSGTIQVGQVFTYSEDVTLAVLDAPAGVTAGVIPTLVTPPGEATLILDVGQDAADGEYIMVISGTAEMTNVHTVEITLTVSHGPAVSLASDAPVELGQAVRFTATATGTQPLTYTWDLGGPGDGTGLDTATPVFTYTTPGTYTARVTVTNRCALATDTVPVAILCDEPAGTLASDSPVGLGQPMHFTATITGTGPLTYTWDFGGPGSDMGAQTLAPVYTYTAAGDFVVSLVVTGPCGAETISGTVTVNPERFAVYLPLVLKDHE